MKQKIDIIIPIYNNSNDELFQCLSSIATQTVRDNIKITIVDDASINQNYEKIIDIFKNFLDIQLLKLKKNVGPSLARQYGIDNTKNDYITFLDADDTLVNGVAIELLQKTLEEHPDRLISYGQVLKQEKKTIKTLSGFQFNIAGKMYKRNFLKINNIKFNSCHSCSEDVAFNQICSLFLFEESNLGMLDFCVYCYIYNKNSLTHQEGFSTKVDKSSMIYGFSENQILSYKYCKNNQNLKEKDVCEHFIFSMVILYWFYLAVKKYNINNYKEINKALKCCKRFYHQVYFDLSDTDYFKKHSQEIISNAMKTQYEKNYICQSIIPDITYWDFLNLLKEGE